MTKKNKLAVSVKDVSNSYVRLVSEFWKRRIRFEYTINAGSATLEKILDKNGDSVGTSSTKEQQENKIKTAKFLLDFTDDYIDPRLGLRIIYSLIEDSNYHISSTAYVPIPFQSNHTLATNFTYSEALDTGYNKTFAEYQNDVGIDCSTSSNPQKCATFLDSDYKARSLGSSESLGGRERLRSYPQGRFTGQYMKFFGVEYRYNFSTVESIIDWYILRDFRTAMQLAFFTEVGSVADSIDELHKATNYRQSTGAGFRLVAKGFVYRLDVAHGDEGTQPTIIVAYPW